MHACDLQETYDGRSDDAISLLIHVAAVGLRPGFRPDQAVQHHFCDLVAGLVAQGHRDVVLRAARGPRDRRLADRGDRAARLLQVLDLEAADDEPRVVGERVRERDVARELAEVRERDRVHALEVVAHTAAIVHLDLGVAGAQHRHGRVDRAGVRRHPADEAREQDLAAGHAREQVPRDAYHVAIAVEPRAWDQAGERDTVGERHRRNLTQVSRDLRRFRAQATSLVQPRGGRIPVPPMTIPRLACAGLALALSLGGCSSPAKKHPLTLQEMILADPLPLAKGSKWTYDVTVKRFDPETDKETTRTLSWITEVIDAREGNGVVAYRIRGWPSDLAAFDLGDLGGSGDKAPAATEKTILRKDNSFLFGASAEPTLDGAEGWFSWPVIDGQKICPSAEIAYCWRVTALETGYRLSYYTGPHDQSYELEPGTGVARFHCAQHGTTTEFEAKLVSYTKAARPRP